MEFGRQLNGFTAGLRFGDDGDVAFGNEQGP